MKRFQTDYLPESLKLFKKIFGKELFDEFNNIPFRAINCYVMDIDSSPASPNIHERFTEDWIKYSKEHDHTFLGMFIGVVYEYGLQQCKNNDLREAKLHLAMLSDGDGWKEYKEKENHPSYSDYMETTKELMENIFGGVLCKKLLKTKMKSFVWGGLDISTSSILAGFPGIKERFSDNWVDSFSEKGYTMIDLFLQTVFHYGYQYGVDEFVVPIRKSSEEKMEALRKRRGKDFDFENLTPEKKEEIKKRLQDLLK